MDENYENTEEEDYFRNAQPVRRSRLKPAKQTISKITSTPLSLRKTKPIETEPFEPKPKQAKIQLNGIPDGFGTLYLERVDGYDLPRQIMNVERKRDMTYLATIREMVENSLVDPLKYTEAYMALLHLEEAAEILNIQQYNQSSLKIHYTGHGRTFRIKIYVSELIFLKL